jgi:multidrug efflux pump subunit AcrB
MAAMLGASSLAVGMADSGELQHLLRVAIVGGLILS